MYQLAVNSIDRQTPFGSANWKKTVSPEENEVFAVIFTVSPGSQNCICVQIIAGTKFFSPLLVPGIAAHIGKMIKTANLSTKNIRPLNISKSYPFRSHIFHPHLNSPPTRTRPANRVGGNNFKIRPDSLIRFMR